MWIIRRQKYYANTDEYSWVYVREDDSHDMGYKWTSKPETATKYPNEDAAKEAVKKYMIDLAFASLNIVPMVGPVDA